MGAVIMVLLDNIKPGQVWVQNRGGNTYGPMLVHVLGVQKDMNGKHKIAIQRQFPNKDGIKANYLQSQLVSPGYFYSLTVKVG